MGKGGRGALEGKSIILKTFYIIEYIISDTPGTERIGGKREGVEKKDGALWKEKASF